MKLTDINLDDLDEVAAARELLSLVLNASSERIAPVDRPDIGADPEQKLANRIEREIRAQAETMLAEAKHAQDPAAIFGAAAPFAPAAAAAAPLPNAPAALPVSSPTMPPAAPAPALPIVPAAVAPSAPAAPSTSAGGVELDSTGLPWDGRIHASTKSKTKAGAWVAKRGINDDTLVHRIEQELRAQVGVVAPAPLPAPWEVAAAPAPLPPASPAPALVPPAPAPAPAAADGPTTFEQIMPRVTQATIQGVLPPTALQAAVQALGLPSVVALQTNPQFVPQVWASLRASYPALA